MIKYAVVTHLLEDNSHECSHRTATGDCQPFAGQPDDLSRVTLEALAAQGYRSGKLTHAKVQRMLGFNSPWQTDAFLKQAGADLDYAEADLERDLAVSGSGINLCCWLKIKFRVVIKAGKSASLRHPQELPRWKATLRTA